MSGTDELPARPLRLFNTLTRRVDDFTAIAPPQVGMYSCGPTVYAYQHIGNLRTYLFSDTLRRMLAWKGFSVRQVMNITDVGHLTSDADEGEDKLELAARREHRDAWEIAEHYTSVFKDDLARLRIQAPDRWCRATDHIADMVSFAESLEGAGWCYRLPSGLYMDTSRVRDYGALARLDLAGQRGGARVEVAQGKRHPSDFAVWRTTPPDETRQMEWDSPWGRGTPGWHLECSVMSIKYLGRHFDIHTGGVDHIPVHHSNEIAQSEAYLADGVPWVRWWLHGEFLNLKGAKISKSAGGGPLLADLIERGYHPLVYRYLVLQAHYRSQLEFTWEALDAARVGLRRLLERFAAARGDSPPVESDRRVLGHLDAFDAALSDDLNTASALATVSAAARDDGLGAGQLSDLAARFDSVLALGLADLEPSALDLPRSASQPSEDEIAALVAERNAARANQAFARSDAIRDHLRELGVVVEDHPAAESTWRWA